MKASNRILSVITPLLLVSTVLVAGCSGGGSSFHRASSASDTARPASGRVSTIPGYTEYYRLMRFNALDQIVLCYPTVDPKGEAAVYAVARDLNGRPVKITRTFFGNPETQKDWTTMNVEYNYYPSTAMLVERRTYHDPTGAPMEVRGAFGMEVLYKGGQLTMRRLIDINGKPIVDKKMVIRSLFREDRPSAMIQEWFFGNGKQYRGIGTDVPGQPFGELPPDAYFRRFEVDARGEVVREEAWDINKRPIAYPGGEIVRAYEHDECGMPKLVVYLDEKGRERPNADGIVRESMRYDDHGRPREWQAFGVTGMPHARSEDGAAAMIFRYRDFDGALVGVDLFDVNGEPIPEPAPN